MLNVAQAAEYLSVTPRFIRRIRHEDRIPAVKIGGHLRFRREDLDKFIADGLHIPDENAYRAS